MLNLIDEIKKVNNLDNDSLLFRNRDIFYRVIRKYLKKLNVNLLIPYLENTDLDKQYLIVLKPDILRKYQNLKDGYSIDNDSIKYIYFYFPNHIKHIEKKTIISLFIAKNFSGWCMYISANRGDNGNYKVNVEEKKRIMLKEDNYNDIVTDMDNYFQNYVNITNFINQKKELYSKYDMNITYSSIYYLLKYWRNSTISSFAQIPKDVMKIICRKASILP